MVGAVLLRSSPMCRAVCPLLTRGFPRAAVTTSMWVSKITLSCMHQPNSHSPNRWAVFFNVGIVTCLCVCTRSTRHRATATPRATQTLRNLSLLRQERTFEPGQKWLWRINHSEFLSHPLGNTPVDSRIVRSTDYRAAPATCRWQTDANPKTPRFWVDGHEAVSTSLSNSRDQTS